MMMIMKITINGMKKGRRGTAITRDGDREGIKYSRISCQVSIHGGGKGQCGTRKGQQGSESGAGSDTHTHLPPLFCSRPRDQNPVPVCTYISSDSITYPASPTYTTRVFPLHTGTVNSGLCSPSYRHFLQGMGNLDKVENDVTELKARTSEETER